jgi:hypothetical protein
MSKKMTDVILTTLQHTKLKLLKYLSEFFLGSYSYLYIIKQQAFVGGACVCVNNVSTQAPPPKAFGGGACVYHEHFGRGACVCHGHLGEELIHVAMRTL